MKEYYLYTFESTHAAIATEKLLREYSSRVMPVPRFISASCGISVRISTDKASAADEFFEYNSRLKTGEYAYYHVSIDEDGDKTNYANVRCDKIRG